MNSVNVFLNTEEVENSGVLLGIAHLGLMPFRYFCRGKTLVIRREAQEISIHHVASFHSLEGHRSKTHMSALRSSWRWPSFLRVVQIALAVVAFLPGLVIGVAFKGLAYLISSRAREDHRLIKEHFTPVNKTIGSENNPIKNEAELYNAIGFWSDYGGPRPLDPKNCRTDAVTIYGQGLKINANPEMYSRAVGERAPDLRGFSGLRSLASGLYAMSPKKIILVDADIVHEDQRFEYATGFDSQFSAAKWATTKLHSGSHPWTILRVREVSSVEEALAAEPTRRPDGRPYREVFKVVPS